MNLEMTLSKNAFFYGRTHDGDLTSALLTMSNQLKKHDGPRFKGVTIDTAANCKSLMSRTQYQSYERDLGRNVKLGPPKEGLRDIGGKSTVLEEATIQILFRELSIFINI